MMIWHLDPLEHDALGELLNLGVGRAAANMSRMVGEQVHLSVPACELLPRDTAARMLSARDGAPLVAVSQDFAGAFSGHALLIFPEAESLEIVNTVIGEAGLADHELAAEALTEIGNVILNGCLSTLANVLQGTLDMSMPRVVRGSSRMILNGGLEEARADDAVLFLYVDFSTRQRNLRGYLALLLDVPGFASLKDLIRAWMRGIMGDGPCGPSPAVDGAWERPSYQPRA